MSDSANRTRKKLSIGATAVVLLAVALTWAFVWAFPPGPDDPSELLRHASASRSPGGPHETGKTIATQGTSPSGAPIEAHLTEVRDASGKVGYAVRLPQSLNLKPGETATLKMPGGGTVTVGAPKKEEMPNRPRGFEKRTAH